MAYRPPPSRRATEQPANPFRRPPRVTRDAQEGVHEFPSLLDDSQWTLAATFAQDDKFVGPSERIGRYYRQRLDELDAAGLEQVRAERAVAQAAAASPLRSGGERAGWAVGLPRNSLLSAPSRPLELESEIGSPPRDPPSATAPTAGDGSGSAIESNSALGIMRAQLVASDRTEQRMYTRRTRSALPKPCTFPSVHC